MDSELLMRLVRARLDGDVSEDDFNTIRRGLELAGGDDQDGEDKDENVDNEICALIIAGWLAGKIIRDNGLGLVGEAAIGIVGALIGDRLLHRFGVHFGSGIIGLVKRHDRSNRASAAVAADGGERRGRSLVGAKWLLFEPLAGRATRGHSCRRHRARCGSHRSDP